MLDAEWHVATEFAKAFATPILLGLAELMRRGLGRLKAIEDLLKKQNGRIGALEVRIEEQERHCDMLHRRP